MAPAPPAITKSTRIKGRHHLWAKKIVDAFSRPENVGVDVIRLEGRMVERLHEREARRVLTLLEAIAALGEG